MRNYFIISVLLLFSIKSHAQLIHYSPDKIDSLLTKTNKKTIVMITADWCQFCDLMKNSTLEDTEVKDLINRDYHFVLLDEHYQKDITHSGKLYTFLNLGGSKGKHELALKYGKIDGQYTLPATCVFDGITGEVIQYSGYCSPEEFIKWLHSLN